MPTWAWRGPRAVRRPVALGRHAQALERTTHPTRPFEPQADRLFRGQPPVYAQHSFADNIVTKLSSGKAEPTIALVIIKRGPPIGVLVGVGIGAAINLRVNIILIAMLFSK